MCQWYDKQFGLTIKKINVYASSLILLIDSRGEQSYAVNVKHLSSPCSFREHLNMKKKEKRKSN